MSFKTHMQDALDASAPVHHRCSHVRSCALKLAQLRRVSRSEMISEIKNITGIDVIRNDLNDGEIGAALEAIVAMREAELDADAKLGREK
jgi:hypothetical protein